MRWVLIYTVLTAVSAAAQDRAEPLSMAELYPPLPGVEYYCTDSIGARVELGDVICVEASCQTWMARCEMTASNRMAMWRKIQDGCPAVELDPEDDGPLQRLNALKNTL